MCFPIIIIIPYYYCFPVILIFQKKNTKATKKRSGLLFVMDIMAAPQHSFPSPHCGAAVCDMRAAWGMTPSFGLSQSSASHRATN